MIPPMKKIIAVSIVAAVLGALAFSAVPAKAQFQPCVWPNRCAAE